MGANIIQSPKQTINIVSAQGEISTAAQKVLFVGQKTAAGSATSGVLVQNVLNDIAAINALFGESSILAAMLRAYKEENLPPERSSFLVRQQRTGHSR